MSTTPDSLALWVILRLAGDLAQAEGENTALRARVAQLEASQDGEPG